MKEMDLPFSQDPYINSEDADILSNVTIKDCVIPIFEKKDEASFKGTAFCIEDYLVTAAHVVPHYRIYYIKNGDGYTELYPNYWIKHVSSTKNNTVMDIAVYPIKGLKSLLTLSREDITTNDVLSLVCWQYRSGILQQVSCDCLVDKSEQCGDMRICTTLQLINGASGCPVFKDGKVYGILVVGTVHVKLDEDFYLQPGVTRQDIMAIQEYNRNTCFILKSSRIIDIIKGK